MNKGSENRIRLVLSDLGGVLTSDIWETLLLTPVLGLADQLGLNHQRVKQTAKILWEQYATTPANEEKYWQDLESNLSVSISSSEILDTEQKLLKANKDIPQFLRLANELDFDIGIISNTTSFWFPKQLMMTGIQSFVNKDLIFLSYEHGRLKEDRQKSLFSIAAERVKTSSTLVIEDRKTNASIAKSYGFKTVLYNMDSNKNSLSSVISKAFEN